MVMILISRHHVIEPICLQAPNQPLTLAEEMKQRMLRRQAAISGKQDQMEQKRERERMAKPVVVLTAKEITAPPPPPPPAAETSSSNRLPNLAMSDNGSDAGDSDDGKASVNDDEVRKLHFAYYLRL